MATCAGSNQKQLVEATSDIVKMWSGELPPDACRRFGLTNAADGNDDQQRQQKFMTPSHDTPGPDMGLHLNMGAPWASLGAAAALSMHRAFKGGRHSMSKNYSCTPLHDACCCSIAGSWCVLPTPTLELLPSGSYAHVPVTCAHANAMCQLHEAGWMWTAKG